MARGVRIAFTLRAPRQTVARLVDYEREAMAGVRDVFTASKERVYTEAQANTPVATGYMRDHLRRESDEDGLGYAVGWAASDFPAKEGGSTKRYSYEWPGGTINIPAPFYPGFVVFGTRFMAGRDPITPALEAERPVLFRALRDNFTKASHR